MLYVSIHAHPAENYPFLSGYEDEVRDYRIEYALSVLQVGVGEGVGYNINFPLPGETNDSTYLKPFKQALKKVRVNLASSFTEFGCPDRRI